MHQLSSKSRRALPSIVCVLTIVAFASASAFIYVAPSSAVTKPRAACQRWKISLTPLGRRDGAVIVATPKHVVVWGGDDGTGSNIALSGASLRLSTMQWEPMNEPPQSSPQGVAVTSSDKVLFTPNSPSLFDPVQNTWTTGWEPESIKNPPLLVETPSSIVVIQLDALRGSNDVSMSSRSGLDETEQLPPPPVRIDYEASAVWLSKGQTDKHGQIVVVQPSGEHLSLDLTTRTWKQIPNAPLVTVNRNLQAVVDQSRVAILGIAPATKTDSPSVAFGFFDVRTEAWSLGPKTAIAPSHLKAEWGSSPTQPTQLIRSSNGPTNELFLITTNTEGTTRVDQYGTSGNRIATLAALPSKLSTKFIRLPSGSIGALFRNGTWGTIC